MFNVYRPLEMCEPKMLQGIVGITFFLTVSKLETAQPRFLTTAKFLGIHSSNSSFKEQAVSSELTLSLCPFFVCPTEEQAFRKRRLCIKFIPRDSTEAAICDIRILGRSKQAPPQYTFIG